jgi:hypothetical protein
MAMSEAYPQRAMSHDFGEGVVGRLNVEVSFDNLQIGRNGSEEFPRFPVCYVAEAEDLANLARCEKLLELGGKVLSTSRDFSELMERRYLCGNVLGIED